MRYIKDFDEMIAVVGCGGPIIIPASVFQGATNVGPATSLGAASFAGGANPLGSSGSGGGGPNVAEITPVTPPSSNAPAYDPTQPSFPTHNNPFNPTGVSWSSGVTNGARTDGQPIGAGCGTAANDHLVPDIFGGISLGHVNGPCFNHDANFSNPGISFQQANANFQADIIATCTIQTSGNWPDLCTSIAGTYVSAVSGSAGLAAYEAAQQQAALDYGYPSTGDYGTTDTSGMTDAGGYSSGDSQW